MKIYRGQKHFTLINPQIRFFKRRQVWAPFLAEKHIVRRQTLLDKFDNACADGQVFIPDARLPPWRRRVNPEFDRAQGRKVNFLGFRVRLAAPPHSTPGFPTHFQ